MKTKSNRFWILIIGIFLALCLAVCGYLIYRAQQRAAAPQVKGPVAVVYLDNQVVDMVDLGTVPEAYTKEYSGVSKGSNTVEFAPGQARVVEASCPDQICVSQGWVDHTSILPIACLPNSLIVEVVAVEEEDPGVDSATQ